MNLPFFGVEAYVPGGVQNQAEENSKNAFRPVPVPKSAFPVSGTPTDLFLRRFRKGISFPNLVERSILKLPLPKLCAVPLALQNRAFFEGREGAKGAEKRGGTRVASKGGKKEKRTRANRSAKEIITSTGASFCEISGLQYCTGTLLRLR